MYKTLQFKWIVSKSSLEVRERWRCRTSTSKSATARLLFRVCHSLPVSKATKDYKAQRELPDLPVQQARTERRED